MPIPRPEHPKPQFQRDEWINLNGAWTYKFDHNRSGMHKGRELFKSTGFNSNITVPFCPESKLSGVAHTDFITTMWYHKKITVPTDWSDKRILLNFGAVDYEAEIFIDGKSAGIHFGGTVSFSIDITDFVNAGKTHNLVVRVIDDGQAGKQPQGKQCPEYKSSGCHYTRTTGIWQTVWMEAVGMTGLKDCQIIPDYDSGQFVFTPLFYGLKTGQRLQIMVNDGDCTVATKTRTTVDGIPLNIPVENVKDWSPESPFLYNIIFEVFDENGETVDSINSYAGMRKVHIEGNQTFLNNKPIYQRLVLDQGFYPDGIWTAPTDEDLKKDIELSMAAGFNGARLHQKVFEERFHYWADQLGYLTWGESSSWGIEPDSIQGFRNFVSEWNEIVVRDRNKPSIIAWTSFNETRNIANTNQHKRSHIEIYNLTKSLDPTRPVNDASGYIHYKTDLWTIHDYARAEGLDRNLAVARKEGRAMHCIAEHKDKEVRYQGQPYMLDEFGGIKWIHQDEKEFADNTWGYGDDIKSVEDFYNTLEAEIDVINKYPEITGWCYTQLTDVEQEQNGIYTYDRKEKFDMTKIKEIFTKE